MPVMVLFGTIFLIMALPKPANPVLEMMVTCIYVVAAVVAICILNYQYGWDR